MKISTRGRYGLRAMINLAEHRDSGAIPLRKISAQENISEHYLEQLFVNLRKAGLVKSVRGAYGGYMLDNPPSEIIVGDIIRALEGPIAPTDCVLEDEEDCELINDCSAHIVWEKVKNSLNEVLDSMTLAELRVETNDTNQESN